MIELKMIKHNLSLYDMHMNIIVTDLTNDDYH